MSLKNILSSPITFSVGLVGIVASIIGIVNKPSEIWLILSLNASFIYSLMWIHFKLINDSFDEQAKLINKTLDEQDKKVNMILDHSGKVDLAAQDQTKIMEDLTKSLNKNIEAITRNALFIPNGFIPVQRRAISIERMPVTEGSIRYAVYGHIPSHIRDNELSDDVANAIYENWKPEFQITEYKDLINTRRKVLDEYLEAGGICYEYYTEKAFTQYIEGHTQFDEIQDPLDEILTRIQKLRTLLEYKNYYIFVFKSEELGPSLLMRFNDEADDSVDIGLLIDLRTPGHTTDFKKRSYGIYTDSIEVCKLQREKLDMMKEKSSVSDKVKIRKALDGLIQYKKNPSKFQGYRWEL